MLNQFNSNTRKLNNVSHIINTNSIVSNDLTGSLLNTEIPTNIKSQTNMKSKPTSIKVVNNKNKISGFHNEILQFSGRSIRKSIDAFDNNGYGHLIINNTILDYDTDGASSENFEVLVYGLHIPGDYTISEENGNVIISLNNSYIDFDNVTINDIYVIGKFK